MKRCTSYFTIVAGFNLWHVYSLTMVYFYQNISE